MPRLLSRPPYLRKIKNAIDKRLKDNETQKTHTLTQEKLIEKLAQGIIDAETFRKQMQSLHQQPQRITSISEHQIQHTIQNIIQKRFVEHIVPYIETIHIAKDKNLIGIYFKMNHSISSIKPCNHQLHKRR